MLAYLPCTICGYNFLPSRVHFLCLLALHPTFSVSTVADIET